MNKEFLLRQENINWLKKRFIKNKFKYKISRFLINHSINYLLERNLRQLNEKNENIFQSIENINQHIEILEEKFHTLNNLCIFLHIPLNIYFEQRMNRLTHITKQYMFAIQQEINEEVEHWKDIHSILSQPLLEPGLLRSYYGGLPKSIQQSPPSEINTIYEENELSSKKLSLRKTFSILSNKINSEDLTINRLNKTFIKIPSSNDTENFTLILDKTISDSENDTTIYIE